MKAAIKLAALTILGSTYAVADNTPQEQQAGSNVAGTERVCLISNSSEAAFADSLKKCKRGDVVALGGVSNLGAAQFCDFTKAILYDASKPVACVYTGSSRPGIK